MTSGEKLKVRPYARLLTMLGEQLIKNDRVALVEIVKNSYDADANEVTVDFRGFSANLNATSGSKIVVTDAGSGMSEQVIREHWMNPATDGKLRSKQKEPKTKSGRFIQGEKGIGRFAIFKLGNAARVISREANSALEFVIEYDLGFLDDNGSADDARSAFLDELEISFSSRTPEIFDGRNLQGLSSTHGTAIEVSGLRSQWSAAEVAKAFNDIVRLQPIVPPVNIESPSRAIASSLTTVEERDKEGALDAGFHVRFMQDGTQLDLAGDRVATLQRLFEDRAVLRVGAYFDPAQSVVGIDVNGVEELHSIDSPGLAGLNVYKRHFGAKKDGDLAPQLECGPFRFDFYVFDLSPAVPTEYQLDSDEKRLVKENRIYLYRDEVRVLPYGDPEDDWLQLDVIRGTQGANRVLSNDQTIGFVRITQKENPALKDKTNREGLLDSGEAYADFVALIQVVIAYVRTNHFARYRSEVNTKAAAASAPAEEVVVQMEVLREHAALPHVLRANVRALETAYVHERDLTKRRLERTEDLAAVGLSVEAASHDIVAMANQALRLSRKLEADLAGNVASETSTLVSDASALSTSLSFVVSRLRDVQGLFVSTRQRRRRVMVANYVDQVARMYSHVFSSRQIAFERSGDDEDFEVLTTDAAMLQVLINLIDNSTYWLEAAKTSDSQIRVTLDAEQYKIIVSDNGPGIASVDAPYIFDPFYSGKGDDGKGLGLYIARQVGVRNGFSVNVANEPDDCILPGANIVLSFHEGDK